MSGNYARAVQERWRAAGVSVVLCMGLGAALHVLVQSGSAAGMGMWALLGALCAGTVSLVWPAVVAARTEAAAPGQEAPLRQDPFGRARAGEGSVLDLLTSRARWRRRLVSAAIGLTLGAGLCAVTLGLLQGRTRPAGTANPTPSPPQGESLSPQGRAVSGPAPVIHIGDHILVHAPDEPSSRP